MGQRCQKLFLAVENCSNRDSHTQTKGGAAYWDAQREEEDEVKIKSSFIL